MFYSHKLISTQQSYTTTKKELLTIVEPFKEFRNILMSQRIVVYADHKNLTYKAFNTEREMRWRLICKQYGTDLQYIQGSNSIVADVLSRLNLTPSLTWEPDDEDHVGILSVVLFALANFPTKTFCFYLVGLQLFCQSARPK